VRRSVSLLCVTALGLTGVALTAPASAAPTPRADSTAALAVPGELIVGYVAGASAVRRAHARGRASARLAGRLVGARTGRTEVEVVRLPQGKNRDQARAQLQSDPAVAYTEPNYVLSHQATATDPIFKSTNAAKDLWGMYGDRSTPANAFGSQAAAAWTKGHTGSQSVYVGVIDEGIQFTHPELSGQVWTNPFESPADGKDNDGNGYVDDVHGWDFANRDNSIYDGGTRGSLDDHGTHVSGTIGAKANNGQGVAGMNWDVTLISGKFLGSNGGTLADAVKAIDYFTDLKTRHGLNIVATNNSWGGGGFSQAMLGAITRANTAGILFVAAAGNSGTNNDTTASYPSGYDVPNVIAVAAISRSGALASFSQYGAKTVDLGAPGVGVWSTTAFSGYSSFSGTSMATPHVTGAAALYASTHSGVPAAQIKSAILGAVVATPSLSGKTVTGGRLNVSGF
jgi:subtilisin family serine protease